ncbi:CHASE2 domain-containing protein, partial [Planktothrix sp. FACHB-1355]
MSKLVILNLGNGNLLEGFPFVTVQLQEEGNSNWRQFTGSLPASADILDIYRRWQLLYELLYEARSINVSLRQFPSADEDIKLDEVDVTHVSDAEFNEVCQKFQNKIDSWLDSEEFRHIDRQLRKQLAPEDRIRVIIQTEDNQLRKIPWHLWRFFRDYRHAEVGLSALEFGPANSAKNSAKQVRILAILGDRTGIDVEADKKLLEKLPNAQTVFLVEPQRRELDEKLWDKQGWDILFFAGHSSTQTDGETGHIYINRADSLTINQLRNSVSKAIERGLQLAIFNSCDGLGLAQQLDDLHIPQIIVMREPVPDKVAQEFLKHFLREFAEGQSFYLAVREARERLQGIETEFPGASWLPAIVDNPAQMQLTWEKLRDKTKLKETPIIPLNRRSKPKLSTILMASFVVTSLVMGVRSIGWLQSWELQAYDGMMRMRSSEQADPRLLIVGADEEDIRKYKHPIPDEILAKLIDKLQQHQPIAIGLDIYRDLPVQPGYPAMIAHFEQNKRLIAVCKY